MQQKLWRAKLFLSKKIRLSRGCWLFFVVLSLHVFVSQLGYHTHGVSLSCSSETERGARFFVKEGLKILISVGTRAKSPRGKPELSEQAISYYKLKTSCSVLPVLVWSSHLTPSSSKRSASCLFLPVHKYRVIFLYQVLVYTKTQFKWEI